MVYVYPGLVRGVWLWMVGSGFSTLDMMARMCLFVPDATLLRQERQLDITNLYTSFAYTVF